MAEFQGPFNPSSTYPFGGIGQMGLGFLVDMLAMGGGLPPMGLSQTEMFDRMNQLRMMR
jgi:hypothetical protein